MKNRIRFKIHPRETGLASIGAGDPDIDIKINGKRCGLIVHPSWNSKNNDIRIILMVVKNKVDEDGNKNCPWKWATLKYVPTSDDDARELLKKNVDMLVEKINLYFEQDNGE